MEELQIGHTKPVVLNLGYTLKPTEGLFLLFVFFFFFFFKSQCQGCTASQLDQDPCGMEPGFSTFESSSSDSNMSKIENYCIQFHCGGNPFLSPSILPWLFL